MVKVFQLAMGSLWGPGELSNFWEAQLLLTPRAADASLVCSLPVITHLPAPGCLPALHGAVDTSPAWPRGAALPVGMQLLCVLAPSPSRRAAAPRASVLDGAPEAFLRPDQRPSWLSQL